MREIKFRAWDVKNRFYLNNVQDSYEGIFDKKYDPNIRCLSDLHKNENYILEQFINLKTKNGKEIYEGDIVKFARHKIICPKCNEDELLYGSYCQGCGKKAEAIEFMTKSKVVFANGGFCFMWHENEHIHEWQLSVSTRYIKWVEIIGNIHDNPELLEATK